MGFKGEERTAYPNQVKCCSDGAGMCVSKCLEEEWGTHEYCDEELMTILVAHPQPANELNVKSVARKTMHVAMWPIIIIVVVSCLCVVGIIYGIYALCCKQADGRELYVFDGCTHCGEAGLRCGVGVAHSATALEKA